MNFFKGSLFILLSGIVLAACSNSQPPAKPTAVEVDDPAIEVKRAIVVTGSGQCQLKVQKGRDDPELISPKSCELTKGASDIVTTVTVSFDAPCKKYQFKNLIGELYFLDDKALGTRNPACQVESFNASYGWSLENA
jgi:hypothetical protein